MKTNSITFKEFYKINSNSIILKPKPVSNVIEQKISDFCKGFILPYEGGEKNHALFDEAKAEEIASYKDNAIQPIINSLKTKQTKDEKEVTALLLLLNRTYDAGAQKSWTIYPELSKFNYAESPNIQVMLAGIYRKIQVPDAFGPLNAMFIKNIQNPVKQPFDPNEEIGGAILEYLRNSNASEHYKKF